MDDDEENYFDGVTISRDEWKAVEALNKLLEVSYSFIHILHLHPILIELLMLRSDFHPLYQDDGG